MDVVPALGILAVSVLGYAIVNSVEIAVVGANRIRVRHMAEEGHRAARAVSRLQHDQDRFFSAVVFLQNVMVFIAALMSANVADSAANGSKVGVILATLLGAMITALFGELIPKVLAAHASERFALAVALPAEGVAKLLLPVVVVFSQITGLVSRLVFGANPEHAPSVSEAELRMLIDMSAESGDVAEEEAELLDRVFHFGDRLLHEVMVPRTEMRYLPSDATVAAFYEVYGQTPHSRFPVVGDGPDHVVGVLGIKDVLHALAEGRATAESPIQPLVRPALLVPETKPVVDLFREMQVSGSQMAIAVDEFGGTAGIVTLEQLLEEMVGPVGDELAPAEREIQEIDEHTRLVDGSLSVEQARDDLEIEIPEGPYDTIAGFVLSELGHIPAENEQLTFDGHSITVTEMRGAKIEMLRVTRTRTAEDEAAEAPSSAIPEAS